MKKLDDGNAGIECTQRVLLPVGKRIESAMLLALFLHCSFQLLSLCSLINNIKRHKSNLTGANATNI